MDTIKFGRIIRERRMELGMTQRQLAEVSQITREQLSNIEREHFSPRISTLLNVLHSLGMKLEVRKME